MSVWRSRRRWCLRLEGEAVGFVLLMRWRMLGWGGGQSWRGKGVGEGCAGGRGVGGWGWGLEGGGVSRIDQALEEADCATFEDEGTITLLGSVSRRGGSQTTRGKAL